MPDFFTAEYEMVWKHIGVLVELFFVLVTVKLGHGLLHFNTIHTEDEGDVTVCGYTSFTDALINFLSYICSLATLVHGLFVVVTLFCG